jgi:hypothetical protein
MIPTAELERIVSVMAIRGMVIHAPEPAEGKPATSGSDTDCLIDGLDFSWPLRLTGGWRICQCIHYDFRGWYWVLERAGDMLALDTVDDPSGLGRDGLRTRRFLDEVNSSSLPVARAVYLTLKRLRKGMLAPEEWSRISDLARPDLDGYRRLLSVSASRRAAELVFPFVAAGHVPSDAVVRTASRIRWIRRFGHPARAAAALWLGTSRYFERFTHPNGLLILIAGPDGSGKSTLAMSLPDLCEGLFKRRMLHHWRPGILPRPGSLAGRAPADPERPHGQAPHGKLMSIALLAYYWVDFLVGGGLMDALFLTRAGFILRERGWWDMAVDPLRYRLDASPKLIRSLGHLVRRPDLAFVLEADPEVLLSRKSELDAAELDRQRSEWRSVLPERVPTIHLDASQPIETVIQRARDAIFQLMEQRTARRVGGGFLSLRGPGNLRWFLPRSPRSAAIHSVRLDQPKSVKARMVWEIARGTALLGGFRLLSRGQAPPWKVREALAPHVPRRGRIAVATANHPGRYVALILDKSGAPVIFAKLATDGPGEDALRMEAMFLKNLAPTLPTPLSAPCIVYESPGLMLLEWIEWKSRLAPWRLDEEVAEALGTWFQRQRSPRSDGLLGPSHGDFAPWNLLRTAEGWSLVDWEHAAYERAPFFDLSHYLVQGHSLLARPTLKAMMEGIRQRRGWVGRAVDAYARGAEVDALEARASMQSYLLATFSSLKPRTAHERAGVRIRAELLDALRA